MPMAEVAGKRILVTFISLIRKSISFFTSGSSAPCSSLPGSGGTPVAVSASVGALNPNSAYHFRISATNAGGTSKGADETFKTLPNAPTVETKAPSAVTQTSAKLNAAVNPTGGEVSECKLEYGTTNAYLAHAPCASPPGSR